MFKTIKARILTLLLSFIFTITLTSVLIFNHFNTKKESLTDIVQKTKNIHVLLLQDIKVMHEFFENETINQGFFKTQESELTNKHHMICTEISSAFAELSLLLQKKGFAVDSPIHNLESNFEVYMDMVDNIVVQILKRGFKDYGVEGNMRRYAHQLEAFHKETGMIDQLQLRRHEKDFIIRQEDQYVMKHILLVQEIQKKVAAQEISDERKQTISQLLNAYAEEFRNLVIFEKKLGLHSYGGMKKEIDNGAGQIESSLTELVKTSQSYVDGAVVKMEVTYLTMGIVLIIISVIVAIYLSKRVSRSTTDLKNKIAQFVESDFTQRTVLPVNNSVNEIDVLITNVSIMEQHIADQMAMLKESNKDLEMLFYATSRDIRSPLLQVRRLVDTAMRTTTDKTALIYFGLMKESWDSLNNIIDELGIVTNIRSIEIKPEEVQLETTVKAVYEEFKSHEWFGNITFSLDVNTQNNFYSSPGLIRAIFRNIIENSIKYSTTRSSESFLKISVSDMNSKTVRIDVSDNGIGIKKEFHDKIFDMFFRGTTYAGGTGLGLYIVKCALEKLNGAISVESDEAGGTTFTIILPNNASTKNKRANIIHKKEMFALTEAMV